MAEITSANQPDETVDEHIRRITRRWAWWASGLAILIGLAGLVLPGYREHAVSLVVGTYFVAVGVGRTATAFDAATTWTTRVVVGSLGIAVVAVGVLCLNNPFLSFAAIDNLVSIGLVLDAGACAGVARIVEKGPERRSAVTTGVASLVGAVVVFVLRIETFDLLLTVSAVCFITVGLASVIGLSLTRGGRHQAR